MVSYTPQTIKTHGSELQGEKVCDCGRIKCMKHVCDK